MDYIIVTVSVSGLCLDMQIPAIMKLGELKNAMAETLNGINPVKFSNLVGMEIYGDGKKLHDDEKSLIEYGIRDGGKIELQIVEGKK